MVKVQVSATVSFAVHKRANGRHVTSGSAAIWSLLEEEQTFATSRTGAYDPQETSAANSL
jgi:hypothetical protein